MPRISPFYPYTLPRPTTLSYEDVLATTLDPSVVLNRGTIGLESQTTNAHPSTKALVVGERGEELDHFLLFESATAEQFQGEATYVDNSQRDPPPDNPASAQWHQLITLEGRILTPKFFALERPKRILSTDVDGDGDADIFIEYEDGRGEISYAVTAQLESASVFAKADEETIPDDIRYWVE